MISGRTDVVIWDGIAIPGVLLVADENLGNAETVNGTGLMRGGAGTHHCS